MIDPQTFSDVSEIANAGADCARVASQDPATVTTGTALPFLGAPTERTQPIADVVRAGVAASYDNGARKAAQMIRERLDQVPPPDPPAEG